MVGITSIMLTVGMHAAYFWLYSGYSKASKSLDMRLLEEIFYVQKGWDHTLVQCNKVISLVGLNLLGLAYCPGFGNVRDDLVLISIVLLMIHSMYSSYYYYGSSNIPLLSKWYKITKEIGSDDTKKRGRAIKKISLVAGALCEIVLLFTAWNYLTVFTAGLLIIHLGIIHFYLMEID